MIIFPAVDIKNGQCVRLFKGEFDTVHKVAESPLDSALNFKNQKATHLHIVDLDGSLQGKPVNHKQIIEIKEKTAMFCEVGGGIRNIEDVEMYINNSIDRVILGSAALGNPAFVKELINKYADKISVSIDSKNGIVRANGWTETSEEHYLDFAKKIYEIGVKHIIYTDIDTDGMLSGPNFEQLKLLAKEVPIDITASGGIKDKSHIIKLKELGFYGAICGKSLYAGTLKLEEIL